MRTGLITINGNISAIDGMRLAVRGNSDPFAEATRFLSGRGIGNNDRATVEGAEDDLGDLRVFFMTDARKERAFSLRSTLEGRIVRPKPRKRHASGRLSSRKRRHGRRRHV